MKMRALVVVLLAVATFTVALVPAADAQPVGFSVDNGRLIDANGNDFIMRGINHPHAWFRDELASLADIKATGANTARVVLSSGDLFDRTTSDEVASIVDQCRMVKLICVLELHDTTGYGQANDAISLDQAADFWIDMIPVLQGQQAHVLINIGNEPFGNSRHREWSDATSDAIIKLRAAGLDHTLMVDAPNWGQDRSFIMRDSAAAVFDSDPERNVVFNVHMFGVFDSERGVRAYLESFVARKLPVVVGEFGATHTDGDPDEDAIMTWTETYGIGYIAWSWSGNVDPVEELNVVANFDASELTTWGRRLIRGDGGIDATSIEASIYEGVVVDPPTHSPSVIVDEDPALVRRAFDHVEAEDGVINGLGESVQGAGFSGTGYVNGLDTYGDSLTVSVFVDHDGTYELTVGYRAAFGDKIQQLYVNGLPAGELFFGESIEFRPARFTDVRLQAGLNQVTIAYDWGWIDLDYVAISSAILGR